MPSRSGMATVGLAVGLVLSACRMAQAGDKSAVNQVNLELQITGLGAKGCEIEIKPAHAGCQFEKITKKVPGNRANDRATIRLNPFLAKSTNADRDCSFAITIKEPDQPPRTYRRGLRLAAPTPSQPLPVQSLTCYLSTPSLVAREEAAKTRR
jgi:hypothetical protein